MKWNKTLLIIDFFLFCHRTILEYLNERLYLLISYLIVYLTHNRLSNVLSSRKCISCLNPYMKVAKCHMARRKKSVNSIFKHVKWRFDRTFSFLNWVKDNIKLPFVGLEYWFLNSKCISNVFHIIFQNINTYVLF